MEVPCFMVDPFCRICTAVKGERGQYTKIISRRFRNNLETAKRVVQWESARLEPTEASQAAPCPPDSTKPRAEDLRKQAAHPQRSRLRIDCLRRSVRSWMSRD